jgi:hypothetical protein
VRWSAPCGTCAGRGFGRRRWCRCRSTPICARRTSSTSAPSTTWPSSGGGVGSSAALFRGDLVLAPPADVVVHDLGGPASHLRGPGPNVRGSRRGPGSGAHRSDGGARHTQGRRFRLHPAAVAFAAHYGVKVTSCRAGHAKRKGQGRAAVPSAPRDLRRRYRARRPPVGLAELNARAQHRGRDDQVASKPTAPRATHVDDRRGESDRESDRRNRELAHPGSNTRSKGDGLAVLRRHRPRFGRSDARVIDAPRHAPSLAVRMSPGHGRKQGVSTRSDAPARAQEAEDIGQAPRVRTVTRFV